MAVVPQYIEVIAKLSNLRSAASQFDTSRGIVDGAINVINNEVQNLGADRYNSAAADQFRVRYADKSQNLLALISDLDSFANKLRQAADDIEAAAWPGKSGVTASALIAAQLSGIWDSITGGRSFGLSIYEREAYLQAIQSEIDDIDTKREYNQAWLMRLRQLKEMYEQSIEANEKQTEGWQGFLNSLVGVRDDYEDILAGEYESLDKVNDRIRFLESELDTLNNNRDAVQGKYDEGLQEYKAAQERLQHLGPPNGDYYGNGVNPQHPDIVGAANRPKIDPNGYGQWGSYNVGRLVRMVDDPAAPWMTADNRSPERVREIIRYLNPGGGNPNNPTVPFNGRYQGPASGTCNGYAKDMMYLMDAPLPYHASASKGSGGNFSASDQHAWLNQNSRNESIGSQGGGWYKASSEQAQHYANQGFPALQVNDGHIAVVVTEPDGDPSKNGHPPYVAEGGAHSTLSNGAYRNGRESQYDHYVYIYP